MNTLRTFVHRGTCNKYRSNEQVVHIGHVPNACEHVIHTGMAWLLQYCIVDNKDTSLTLRCQNGISDYLESSIESLSITKHILSNMLTRCVPFNCHTPHPISLSVSLSLCLSLSHSLFLSPILFLSITALFCLT